MRDFEGEEFQFGNLMDYVKLQAANEKKENTWTSPTDYVLDLSVLLERLAGQKKRIAQIRYEISPDMQLQEKLPKHWLALAFD